MFANSMTTSQADASSWAIFSAATESSRHEVVRLWQAFGQNSLNQFRIEDLREIVVDEIKSRFCGCVHDDDDDSSQDKWASVGYVLCTSLL